MTPAEFRRLLAADPFVPFIVTLTGGATQVFDHPEWVTVPPGSGCAKIVRPDGHWAMIALGHVVAVAFPDEPHVR